MKINRRPDESKLSLPFTLKPTFTPEIRIPNLKKPKPICNIRVEGDDETNIVFSLLPNQKDGGNPINNTKT
jgi:hypothetical protein